MCSFICSYNIEGHDVRFWSDHYKICTALSTPGILHILSSETLFMDILRDSLNLWFYWLILVYLTKQKSF